MENGFDKRALIAIVLSMIVLILYQVFFMPPPPEEPPQKPEKKVTEIPAETEIVKEVQEREYKPIRASEEKLITIETPLYRAVLSSKGATVKEWKLKKYLDDKGNEISLTKEAPVPPPLAIGFDEDFGLKNTIFDVEGNQDIVLNEGKTSVSFVFADEGVYIKRTFTFYADDYRIDLTEEVKGKPSYWVTLGSGFGISGTESYGGHIGPVVLKYSDRIEIKKLKQPKIYQEGLRWVAQEDKYFFSSIVPPKNAVAKIWTSKDTGEPLVAVKLPKGKHSYIVYVGPKEHDRLKMLGVGLEHIVDFGFFSILARPLFWILKFFYKIVGNYGWAIVILTIITRIPFIPLINKGQKSMKKLQAIQPKMVEIREKYKKDPKKMQEEMMKLYKKYKVNPMSGCLPILIQLPVFFALYKVLLIAIELRGAPFMFWIQDLSKKDPYYILPIVMGITMYIQQKMTPTATNTQQQKIMQFLPIIFTFLFLNFPSGLVLYWLVSNILSIIQQWYINKKTKLVEDQA